MLEFRFCKVKVVSLARKILTLGGSSSWVLFTEEKGLMMGKLLGKKALSFTATVSM